MILQKDRIEAAIRHIQTAADVDPWAMELAVEALKAQMDGDVVSRNAIIKKLNAMDRYKVNELVLCDTDEKFPKNEVFIVDDVYEGIVEQLPSAHPEPCEDAVSRKLMYELGATCIARRDDNGELVALGRLDMLPSVQPELCEYYALCRHGRDESKLRARLKFCEYCNEDSDGYVKPIEKKTITHLFDSA